MSTTYLPSEMAAAIRAIPNGGGGNYYTAAFAADKIGNLRIDEDTLAAIQSADSAGLCAATLQFDPANRDYAAFCGLMQYAAGTASFTGYGVAEGQTRDSTHFCILTLTATSAGFSIVDENGAADADASAAYTGLPVALTVYLPAAGGAAGASEWTGTQAAYDAMAGHDSGTTYYIVEGT